MSPSHVERALSDALRSPVRKFRDIVLRKSRNVSSPTPGKASGDDSLREHQVSDAQLFDNLFLSIGAMKAGTTWLYAVLERHPELHFTREKEIHYYYHSFVNPQLLSESYRMRNARDRYLKSFDPQTANIERVREIVRWVGDYLERPVDDLWYRNLFRLRGQQVYACDFSNLTALVPADAWPHILGKARKLRVLYTMRDPVKRLWSHVKFHLQFTNQIEEMKTWKPSDYERFVYQPFIWDVAEYGKVLRNLRQGLPAEVWKAIFFERMQADQRGTLREIEDFLGISHFDYPDALLNKRINESARIPMPEFFPGIVAQDVKRIRDEVEAEGFALPVEWG